MAYVPVGVDAHRDQDIRVTLSRLSALAERTGCTILLLRHLNKTAGRDPLYRGGGSIGIVGAARAGLLAASDPDDPERRVLATLKNNLGPMPPSLAYRLADTPEHGCARVTWDGSTEHTARTLLNSAARDDEPGNPAKEFIVHYLMTRGSEAAAADVLKAGRAAGFSDQELKDARRRSSKPRIKSRKGSFDDGWVWAIDPPEGGKPPEGGSEGGEGGTNINMPPSPPSGDEMPPSEGGRRSSEPPREHAESGGKDAHEPAQQTAGDNGDSQPDCCAQPTEAQTHSPRAQQAPGDATDRTTDDTERVQQTTERLNGTHQTADREEMTTVPTPSAAEPDGHAGKPARRLCPCGRPAPINPETGLCYWCERKAAAAEREAR
ncbi:hypothetical protein JMUB5695_01672 [Mycobacterium heckeshornense]|nr:hypothetical protein JMUB5695_01672 [Mycobacterium heckeshornense]